MTTQALSGCSKELRHGHPGDRAACLDATVGVPVTAGDISEWHAKRVTTPTHRRKRSGELTAVIKRRVGAVVMSEPVVEDPRGLRRIGVSTLEHDFADIERRPGGGGAGAVVWLLAVLTACVLVGITV